ncbi:DUF4885 family protein [Arcobacter defluvii]|uniref:DUF4885 domain-containing protein n=1 Tax=Arcobacter defluvii TaxID=873191 RepID=A0AAE7BG21_9BACT|nr:DUF4885 family protein [Arcobacter defluvii]QKF78418.1 DUF4885 domain-containing protein [Arcobacter defluvii]
MTITNTTQSFSSLKGAIKVTNIDNNSSKESSDTLADAVSVNIDSDGLNTTSLLNSLEEETVIQARNGYVNEEEKKQKQMIDEHYAKMNEENKNFAYPSAHISEKYFDIASPYYVEGLTKEERKTAYSQEINYLNNGHLITYRSNDPVLRDMPLIYGDVDVAQRKAYDREKVNEQFQTLLNKYNVTIPQDTKLTFTIDPNTLKATVSGTDDETLAKAVEDVMNTANNAKELFRHIISSRSDDSTQYNGTSASKYNLTQNIKNVTGYNLKDLEIKDGKFVTEDGTNVAEIYIKKINENPNMSDFVKQMSIASNVAGLTKLAKNGFDSVPDLVLSIDYENGSFYDVKQSENFGTGKRQWIDELKASKPKNLTNLKIEEESSSKTEILKEAFEIISDENKNIKLLDKDRHILSKEELMLKYLLGYEEEIKNEDLYSFIEKLKKKVDEVKIDNNIS